MSENNKSTGYDNPPIQEALVEFRFAPGQEWDPTFDGKMHSHERIKLVYTGKPRQQKMVEAQFQATADQPASFAVREGPGRTQLLTEDGTRLLSLAPDVLTVHELAPYSGWESFRPRIKAALEAYQDIAAPESVVRITVRYINAIEIPLSQLDLSAYFKCSPPHLEELPSTMGGFMNRAEYVDENGIKLLLSFATIEAPKGSSGFILDLDFSWEGTPISLTEAMSIVDDLHDREGRAFESAITHETRRIFNAP